MMQPLENAFKNIWVVTQLVHLYIDYTLHLLFSISFRDYKN